jgi:hypothetical protein
MPTVKSLDELPRFFNQKDSKLNVKESHLLQRNALLQQEIKNADAEFVIETVKTYSSIHRKVHELDTELQFYRSVLNRLIRAERNE